MNNLKDRDYCKYKINKDKHNVMKNYHEKNWKYNILRWNKKLGRDDYRKKLESIRERRRHWKRHPKDLKKEIYEFEKKWGKDKNKWSRENSEKYEELTTKLNSRLKDMNTYHGWKTYQKQQKHWEGTPVGACLKARITHYNDMKRKWGRMNGRQKHHSTDHLHKACHKVRQSWLPFGNKGCMNELDKEYALMLEAEKNLKNRDEEFDAHVKRIAVRTEHIFNHKCQNWVFKHKAPHCENYLKQKMNADAKKIHRKFRNDIDNRWMSKMITNYEEIYDTLMDERFWLNAPHDCHIGKVSAPIEDEKNGIMKWLKALRKRRWSSHKHKSWKAKGNWRKRWWRRRHNKHNKHNKHQHGHKQHNKHNKHNQHNRHNRHHGMRRHNDNDWEEP